VWTVKGGSTIEYISSVSDSCYDPALPIRSHGRLAGSTFQKARSAHCEGARRRGLIRAASILRLVPNLLVCSHLDFEPGLYPTPRSILLCSLIKLVSDLIPKELYSPPSPLSLFRLSSLGSRAPTSLGCSLWTCMHIVTISLLLLAVPMVPLPPLDSLDLHLSAAGTTISLSLFFCSLLYCAEA